ncbi:MAG: cadherin-like beta sandwich domain-containing protein [Ruminococcus sp.]|nr:cadherin-like beta sandwich domain-containing protein [Ruminococcus sp.]
MRIEKKRIIAALISAVIMAVVFSISSFAAGTATIGVPKSVEAGKDFTVSVKITAENDIGFVQGMISYDDSVAEFKSSDFASGGSGVININGFPDSPSKELSFNITFTALNNGNCKMSLTNCFVTSPEGDQIGSPTADATVSVKGDAPANNDTSKGDLSGTPEQGCLKSLTVSQGELKPAFAYDIYDYHVDVGADVESCEIEGVTANPTDMIWYTGNENLAVGDNVRTIKVTDKDGYSHVYTVTITRAQSSVTTTTVQTEVATTTVEPYVEDVSSVSDASSRAIIDDKENGLDKYKFLTPALIIVLITLIIALVVLIVWLKKKGGKKSGKRRR